VFYGIVVLGFLGPAYRLLFIATHGSVRAERPRGEITNASMVQRLIGFGWIGEDP
jgi:hypothetical protein